jgi:hypothetical protein
MQNGTAGPVNLKAYKLRINHYLLGLAYSPDRNTSGALERREDPPGRGEFSAVCLIPENRGLLVCCAGSSKRYKTFREWCRYRRHAVIWPVSRARSRP